MFHWNNHETIIWLVVWNIFYFSIFSIYWESYSQRTNSFHEPSYGDITKNVSLKLPNFSHFTRRFRTSHEARWGLWARPRIPPVRRSPGEKIIPMVWGWDGFLATTCFRYSLLSLLLENVEHQWKSTFLFLWHGIPNFSNIPLRGQDMTQFILYVFWMMCMSR
jgi:hypothetical protein